MDHEYSHEYMHEHGIPHDHHGHDADYPHAGNGEHAHEHTPEHTHADGTTHSHPHEHAAQPQGCPGAAACGSDCSGCEHDPRAEVVALMQYMVNHNTAHANELVQLAGRLKDLGDVTAFEQVMQAVSDFEKGNMRLSTVLAALNATKA
ncbi:MAG: cobalt transporter [Clostridia bacterium]|nr:cobalt transporter [Clostridia bacterium]